MLELAEFSLAELESATFCFSESFKLGQGGNKGCIYKGEMMGTTVAITRLHPHSMQLQQDFQQEVRVLSKLQHPHLVTLLGYGPEAWPLVYEYLPNGNLQDQLFRKTSISPFSWVARTRIIAEISSALCFLNSIKPERIVHGDFKPENILLDSKLTSKLCDLGIWRLIINEEVNGMVSVAGQLANIGLQCYETNSKDTPNLTPSIVRERAVPSFYLSPILQEIKHDCRRWIRIRRRSDTIMVQKRARDVSNDQSEAKSSASHAQPRFTPYNSRLAL